MASEGWWKGKGQQSATMVTSMDMKRSLLNIILACVLATSLTGCFRQEVETDIILLATSDVRGNFMGYNFLEDKQYRYGLASFATLVKENRSLYGDRLLVLDAGERQVSSALVQYSQVVDTIGEPPLYAMERFIGYDVVGLGLNDRQEAEIIDPKRHDPEQCAPIVCANVIDRKTGRPVFKPYIILERNDVKIAILGISDLMYRRWLQDDAWIHTTDQDVAECIRQWIPEIQRQQPDLIVGMFHQVEITPELAAPFDFVLTSRERTPYQTTISPWEGHHVPVVGMGRYASHAGLVKIHLTRRSEVREGEPRYEKQFSTALINLDDFEQDAEFVSRWKSYNDTLVAWVNKPLAYLNEELRTNKGMFGSDEYRRLVHNVQLKTTGADISMATCLSPNAVYDKGNVSIHTIYDMYPHENQLLTLKMSLNEVRLFLEYGYAQQYRTISKSEKTTDPLRYRYDRKGHLMYTEEGNPKLYISPSHYTSAAGIIYEVDITQPAGRRVTIKGFEDGREMDPEAFYTVCLNSFQAGGEFIKIGLGWSDEEVSNRTVPTPSHSIRHLMCEIFGAMDTINVGFADNWKLVPTHLLDLEKTTETYQAYW